MDQQPQSSQQPNQSSVEEVAVAEQPNHGEVVGGNVTDISKAKKSPNSQIQKARAKAQSKIRERINRWKNANQGFLTAWRKTNPDSTEGCEAAFEQAAWEALRREDYESMPTEKKVRLLERNMSGFSQGIIRDVQALQHNDLVISNVFDVNLRAIASLFEKLGISREEQGKVIIAVQDEIALEEIEGQKNDQQGREKAACEALNKAVDTTPSENAVEQTPPADATEFT